MQAAVITTKGMKLGDIVQDPKLPPAALSDKLPISVAYQGDQQMLEAEPSTLSSEPSGGIAPCTPDHNPPATPPSKPTATLDKPGKPLTCSPQMAAGGAATPHTPTCAAHGRTERSVGADSSFDVSGKRLWLKQKPTACDSRASNSLPLFELVPVPESITTCVVSGAGISFSGALPTGESASLLLGPTCTDAVIINSSATGAPRHQPLQRRSCPCIQPTQRAA